MKLHHWKFRRIERWSKSERIYRWIRIVWQRGNVGDGKGYSAMFTVSFCPRLFRVMRDDNTGDGWYVILVGLRLHFQRCKGGIHP